MSGISVIHLNFEFEFELTEIFSTQKNLFLPETCCDEFLNYLASAFEVLCERGSLD